MLVSMSELREKVIKGMECCTNPDMSMCLYNCPYHTDGCSGGIKMMRDALAMLKAQEQEISRLKHHVDCNAAEKLPSGCVGYGRGFNDDEPCETCAQCPAYNGYGEE